MRSYLKFFLLLSLAPLLFVPRLYAQEKAPKDSTFEARRDSAWAKVSRYWDNEQWEKADSVQRAFSSEAFRYYRRHPNTESGKDAALTAFMMWGNIGADKKAEEALSHLDYDSKVWADVLVGAGNAFARSDRVDEYFDLLQEVEPKLTPPESRSAVMLQLAGHYKRNDERQKAKERYRKVVNLDADSIMVEKAMGNLYEMESLTIGQKAPTFEAETVSGDSIALSDLRGKVVLLEFWASWCGPCRPEIPHLKTVWSEYKEEDFQLIGISLDENREDMTQFIEKEGLTWPQVQQEEGWEGEIAEQYNVMGIPRAYLIGRNGKIAAKDFRKEEIEKEVRRLMETSEE